MLDALIAELASIEDPRCAWKVEHRLLDIPRETCTSDYTESSCRRPATVG